MSKNQLTTIQKWAPTLPFEIAEFEVAFPNPLSSIEEICELYDLTIDQLNKVRKNTEFMSEVADIKGVLKDTNSVIRKKASKHVQVLMDNWVQQVFVDREVSQDTKIKLFAQLNKMARITDDPTESAKVDPSKAISNVPSIIINLSQDPTISFQPIEKALN